MPNLFSISLDKKLVFLVMVVSVVSLATSAFLSFNFSEEILKKRVGDQLISESTIRGNAIKTLFDTRIKETQILATDPAIQNLVDGLNRLQFGPELESKIKEDRRHFVIEVKAFRELVGYSIGFVDVKIIGKQGKVFFSLGKLGDDDFSHDPRFIHGVTEAFVELEPTPTGERKMVVTTPIFGSETSNTSGPIGVIIAEMSTVELDKILLTRSGLGETGEVYLVNPNYLMISESRFIKNAAFNQRVDTIPVRTCFEQGEDFGGRYQDYRENSIFGFSYCAKDLGFVLMAEIDESEMFQPVTILQDKIFVTGVFITIGMAVATFFLSKLFSRPIIKLKDAANEIAQGNFDIRTNIKTSDEIGQLSLAFDSMAKKIQESLLTIKQREAVIKQQQNVLLQFSDQSQNYFVCFLDVIESTRLTAKLSDLESGKFYSIFLNSMANKIESFDGIVVKNIGDALLFYFPRTNSQDERELKNALECCLAISEFHKEINKKMEEGGLPSLSYKISATYGSVRVAKIATSSIEDIFGSTVNKCAKINRLAPPNGVVIGDALYQMVKSVNTYNFEMINSQSTINEYGHVYLVSRK
jgi:class 3 adenylate cyclase